MECERSRPARHGGGQTKTRVGGAISRFDAEGRAGRGATVFPGREVDGNAALGEEARHGGRACSQRTLRGSTAEFGRAGTLGGPIRQRVLRQSSWEVDLDGRRRGHGQIVGRRPTGYIGLLIHADSLRASREQHGWGKRFDLEEKRREEGWGSKGRNGNWRRWRCVYQVLDLLWELWWQTPYQRLAANRLGQTRRVLDRRVVESSSISGSGCCGSTVRILIQIIPWPFFSRRV